MELSLTEFKASLHDKSDLEIEKLIDRYATETYGELALEEKYRRLTKQKNDQKQILILTWFIFFFTVAGVFIMLCQKK